MEIEFKRGEFIAFRATTKFHLGAIEQDVMENDVILFDGQVSKIGGAEHNIPLIRSAVKLGWLVPADDTTSRYKAKPAGVPVRPAQAADRERGKQVEIQTVQDEERDLGTLKTVRDRGDGVVRKQVVAEDAGSEGVPVGKLRTPANQKTTLTAENAMRVAQEIRKVDNVQGTPDQRVIPVKVAATGDVQEAKVGDALDELLGDAAVAKLPPVGDGPLGEGDQPHLTADEKEAKRNAAAAAAEAARQARLAQVGTKSSPAPAAPAEPAEVLPPDTQAKMALVKAALPNFEWDMSRQWRVRVKDALDRRNDPLFLNGILAVETETVKKHIQAALTSK